VSINFNGGSRTPTAVAQHFCSIDAARRGAAPMRGLISFFPRRFFVSERKERPQIARYFISGARAS